MTQTTIELTKRQLEILQHSLGVDRFGQGRQYRNHFCAGGTDAEVCKELVDLGFMKQHETTSWLPYYNCSVTTAGKAAMSTASPKPPRLTRSQIRYREFLEADSSMTFFEWIKTEKLRKAMDQNPYAHCGESIFEGL
jgi:hypothetical protein